MFNLLDNLPLDFINEGATPAAKEIGKTISDAFYLIFHPIQNWAEKVRIKSSHNLELYKKEIAQQLSEIPDDKYKDPPLSIIGPALEASKYYIDDENPRIMFARLIAMACNKDMEYKVHASFVEIIKQMSPIDCSNINTFFHTTQHPIADICLVSDDDHVYTLIENMFLSNENIQDINIQSKSLDNLVRLGLLRIDKTLGFTDDKYDLFYKHILYSNLEDILQTGMFDDKFDISQIANCTHKRLRKGVISTTSFGDDFIDVCIG